MKYLERFDYKVMFVGFILFFFFIIALTPVHEATHWVTLTLDPFADPTEFHVFDIDSANRSALGYVLASIKPGFPYPSSFVILHETIAYGLQLILATLITIYIMNSLYHDYDKQYEEYWMLKKAARVVGRQNTKLRFENEDLRRQLSR